MRKVVTLLAAIALGSLVAGCLESIAPPRPTGQPYVVTPAPAGRGVVAAQPTPNRTRDPSKTPVVVLGLSVDAQGRETVRVANISTIEQGISLWSVFNPRTERRFDFPAGTVLQPSQVVEVHSGPGSAAGPPSEYVWSQDRQWTEAKEDVLLTNQAGRLMYWYAAALN